ncbi:MAG: hypothetical protein C3F13_17890 [Anaerolineales bacterium]|nr:MAG: hypothetical protein C3F13_17890 [Anaerolineales bacterium]
MLRQLFRNTIPPIVEEALGWNITGSMATPWLSIAFLVALEIGFGLVLAKFISNGAWLYALVLVLLVPAAILFYKNPFTVFIIWLLATPFLMTTTTSQLRMLYWLVYRALPPLAVCATLIANQLRPANNRLRFRLGLDSLVMVIFLGWVVLNIYWYHPSDYLPYLYLLYDMTFVPFCLYWWIRFAAPVEQDLKRLVPGAFILVLFEVAVGLLSWLEPGMLPRAWVGYASNRTIGTLGYYTTYSLTLVFFSLLLFQAAMHQKSRTARLALLCAAGIGAAGVLFSFSRGCWLGGVAAGVGLFFLYPKPVLRLAAVLLIVIAILGSTVLYKQLTYADQRLNSEETAVVRLLVWDAGLQMIQHKPFWGWGYGDYRLYAGLFQRKVADVMSIQEQAYASHNAFISIAAELGVPGLLLYLFPAMWWLAISIKRRQQLPQAGFLSRKLLIIFWLVILAFSTTSFFSDIRVSPYALSLWWVSLGLIATLVEPFRLIDGQRS